MTTPPEKAPDAPIREAPRAGTRGTADPAAAPATPADADTATDTTVDAAGAASPERAADTARETDPADAPDPGDATDPSEALAASPPDGAGPGAAREAPHVATVLRLAGAMQRIALVLSVAVAVVAVAVATLLRGGGEGLAGAVIGALLGIGAGLLGTVVMRGTARATPAGVMIGAMAAFTGKIVVLMVFLIAFRETALFDNETFAFTLLAVTAAYIVGEVIGFVRTRIPVLDI
jgi:ATP synthase protein I